MADRSGERWEEVFRGPSLVADVLAAGLESHGIEVQMLFDSGHLLPVGGIPDARLFVPLAQADEATRLIADSEPRPA